MSKDKNLDDLIYEWEARVERGEPVDFLQLSGNNPDLARQLEQVIGLLHDSRWMDRTPTDLLINEQEGSGRLPLGSINFSSLPLHQVIVADGLQVGDVIHNRYRLIYIIGEGGSAHIWLANDMTLERLVAVKAFKRSVLNESSVQLFLNEARIMARFEHPTILPIHDQLYIDGRLFLILKYVPRVNDRPNSNYRETIRIILQVSESLKFLHANRVLHCDIKPSNILVDSSGHAYLTDYGVAIDDTAEDQIQSAGTKGYMAPERLAGHNNSQQTDIYSLGVVLRQFLTGDLSESNFESQTKNALNQFPVTIRKIVEKATSDDPENRYQTIEEFAFSLRKVLNDADKKSQSGKYYAVGFASMVIFIISIVYLLPKNNSFKTASQIKLNSNEQFKILSGDWDGDSDIDVAAYNLHNRIDIFLNDGKGGFQFHGSFNREHPTSDSSSGKFSGARKNVIIQCIEHKPEIYINEFDGTRFIPRYADRVISLLRPTFPSLIDLDNDGLSDLVCLDRDTNDISIRFAESDTIFGSDVIFSATDNVEDRTRNAFFADLNQDKKLDILIPFQSQPGRSGISILFQSSDQEFKQSSTFYIDGNVAVGIGCLSDYDADGDLDFILPDTRGNRVIGFQNDGTGNLGKYSTLIVTEKPLKIIELDTSVRHRMDYALVSETTGFSIIGPVSDQNWQMFEQYNLFPSENGILTSDVDNDGTPELIVRSRSEGFVQILKRKK